MLGITESGGIGVELAQGLRRLSHSDSPGLNAISDDLGLGDGGSDACFGPQALITKAIKTIITSKILKLSLNIPFFIMYLCLLLEIFTTKYTSTH